MTHMGKKNGCLLLQSPNLPTPQHWAIGQGEVNLNRIPSNWNFAVLFSIRLPWCSCQPFTLTLHLCSPDPSIPPAPHFSHSQPQLVSKGSIVQQIQWILWQGPVFPLRAPVALELWVKRRWESKDGQKQVSENEEARYEGREDHLCSHCIFSSVLWQGLAKIGAASWSL